MGPGFRSWGLGLKVSGWGQVGGVACWISGVVSGLLVQALGFRFWTQAYDLEFKAQGLGGAFS